MVFPILPLIRVVRHIKRKREDSNDAREVSVLQYALQQESLQFQSNGYLSPQSVILIESGTLYLQQSANQRLVYAGPIMLFLFADSIVICAEYPPGGFTFRERVSLHDLALRDSDGMHGRNDFQLVGFDRQYVFICDGRRDKKAWLTAFASRYNPMAYR